MALIDAGKTVARVRPDAPPVARLARISLTSANAAALARFYEQALGCRCLGSERRESRAFQSLMQVQGGATAFILQSGAQWLELLQFDHPGKHYPRDADAAALIFQHFAIVVTDMAAAYEQLSSTQGWEAISRGGPQQLPSSSGGAMAFKFRDPEGHPLELLAPRLSVNAGADAAAGGVFSGIDHSAISVSDTALSVRYYTAFGLAVSGGSINSGIEQERLDGVISPHVQVTALTCLNTTPPHLELLCYRQPRPQRYPPLASNDIATTRLIFQRASETPASQLSQRCIDPDGHHLIVE